MPRQFDIDLIVQDQSESHLGHLQQQKKAGLGPGTNLGSGAEAMRTFPKAIAICVALLLVMATPSIAGTMERAHAAILRGDYRTALELYRRAADQGNAEAQYNLGVMFDRGEGTREEDAQALSWFRKAAQQGLAIAEYNLADMYDRGDGVPEDNVQAAAWLLKAAEHGNPHAQSKLGALYARGHGVPRDDTLGAILFRKAANQGLAEAQSNLGVMYVKGRGVPKDYVLAYMWFTLAARNGYFPAEQYREAIDGKMTRKQIGSAKSLVAEWVAAHPKR